MWLNQLNNHRFLIFAIISSLLVVVISSWLVFSSKRYVEPLQQNLPFDSILFGANNQDEFNANLLNLKPIMFPHVIEANTKYGWYILTFKFNKKEKQKLWGVYIPDKGWNAAVFVNGNFVGKTPDKSLMHPNWRAPAFFTIAEQLFVEGKNQIAIRLDQPGGIFFLSNVFLGESEYLINVFNNKYFLTVTLNQIIILMMWSVFIFAVVLWWQRKNESAHFWFALMTFMWSVHASFKLIPTPSFADFEIIRIIFNNALLWFVVTGFFFVSRTIGKKNYKFELFLFFVATTLCIGYLLTKSFLPEIYPYYKAYIFMLAIVFIGVINLFRLVFSFYFSGQMVLLITCLIVVLSVGIHDYFLVTGFISGAALLQYSAPILILFFLVQLTSRYLNSLKQKEEIYQSFDIQAQHIESDNSVDWTKVKERERILASSEERKRMKQELHDGVSGSLVSMLSSLRLGKHKTEDILFSLEDCISELRSIFDNDYESEQNLAILLYMFRHKIETKLEIFDIHLHWSIMAVSDEIELDVTQSVHISRIIQECFTNIIKHSQASKVIFEASSRPLDDETGDQVSIIIRDNGQPTKVSNSKGHGLNNMSERAEKLNGDFQLRFSKQDSEAVFNFIIKTK